MTDFNRDNAPMHDEGSSVLLVVYRSAFERLSIREGLAETLQYLFVGGRALQNTGVFPNHFFCLVTGQNLKTVIGIKNFSSLG
jgi:hypothetical protein